MRVSWMMVKKEKEEVVLTIFAEDEVRYMQAGREVSSLYVSERLDKNINAILDASWKGRKQSYKEMSTMIAVNDVHELGRGAQEGIKSRHRRVLGR